MSPTDDMTKTTDEVINCFNRVFQERDATLLEEIIAPANVQKGERTPDHDLGCAGDKVVTRLPLPHPPPVSSPRCGLPPAGRTGPIHA